MKHIAPTFGSKKNPANLTGFFNIGNEITIILPSGFLRIPSGACSGHR